MREVGSSLKSATAMIGGVASVLGLVAACVGALLRVLKVSVPDETTGLVGVIGLALWLGGVVAMLKSVVDMLKSIEQATKSIAQEARDSTFLRISPNAVKEMRGAGEAVEHMAKMVLGAKGRIVHLSIAGSPGGSSNRFEEALRTALEREAVTVHYVGNFDTPHRAARVAAIWNDMPHAAERYHVKQIVLGQPDIAPVFNFLIVDDEEIVLAVSKVGVDKTFISSRDAGLVKSFAAYFDLLWDRASEYQVPPGQ